MSVPTCFVGLDLDLKGKQLCASIGTRPWKLVAGPVTFPDSITGYEQLVAWLQHHHGTTKQTVLCMQASGFLGEPLAYFLATRGYRIAIEPPVKVKRAQAARDGNRHAIDSRDLAEYACRHLRMLHAWQPCAETLQQVQVLLTERGPARRVPARKGSGKSRGAGAQLLLARGDRSRTIDVEIRRLLLPKPNITDEWPCY